MTNSAVWTSSDGAVATVSNTGLVTAVAVGDSTITATAQGISGTASVHVNSATVASLVISPANPTVSKGTDLQFTATATYSDGSVKDVTKLATWSSSLPATVSINNLALATAHKVGQVTISATLGTSVATTSMTVVP